MSLVGSSIQSFCKRNEVFNEGSTNEMTIIVCGRQMFGSHTKQNAKQTKLLVCIEGKVIGRYGIWKSWKMVWNIRKQIFHRTSKNNQFLPGKIGKMLEMIKRKRLIWIK